MTSSLTALCVGRHRYLSEHLGHYFRRIGVHTRCAIGLQDALAKVRDDPPHVVICDYDLLASVPLQEWESQPALRSVPIVAVSLTRRADEMHLPDVNGI